METHNTYVDTRNSRGGTQDEVMKKIIEAGGNPFSEENLPKHHKKPILKKTSHWLITTSQWPYTNSKHHILFISRRYVEDVTALTIAEWNELLDCLEWAKDTFKISGGAFAMRFGDTLSSGATVKHLHAHLIEPDTEGDNYDAERVRFFIGGNKE